MFRDMNFAGLPFKFTRRETLRTSVGPSLLLPLLLSLMVLSLACDREPPPPIEPEVPKPVVKEQLPANFVVCIDNSASIRGEERVLIRETTMLLADLADIGDRISVITFGKGARLAASTHIESDQDRIEFKNHVRQRVDFQENYSDIRAGIKLLAENQRSPLRQAGFDPYVIILSDGKLEPADRKTQRAFNEMKEVLERPLANINIYAVVLGNTYCYDRILTNVDGADLNGKTLMRDHIARAHDLFFHAQKLDQLFQIAVRILSAAKGITSLADKKDTNKFKIDNSVESMTFIVRKKKGDGTLLCKSSEIVLNKPAERPDRDAESTYKSSDYQYFDLIVVRNPREGMWSITLANGKEPEVLSKIVTPLELKFSYRDKYYLNETATMRGWILDKRFSEVVSSKPHIIKAHLATDGNLDESNIYADFHPDPNSGQYYLEVPGEMLELLRSEGKPLIITMEVTAQRFRTDSQQLDPWFIRRVGPVDVQLVEPFVDWLLQEPRIFKIPFVGKTLHSIFEVPIIDDGLFFGAVLQPSRSQYPDFEGLPRLKFVLEILDDDPESYLPMIERTLHGADEAGRIIYRTKEAMKEPGKYRYFYQVDGVVKLGGAFTIKSPTSDFEIRSYKLECWLALIILALFVISRIYCLTGKLQGDLTIKEYQNGKLVNSEEEQLYQRTYDSAHIALKARRGCFLKNKIIVKVKDPNSVMVIDGQMTQKKKELLDPGDHKIVLSENGTEIKIETDLYV
jgi:hypothetical protein